MASRREGKQRHTLTDHERPGERVDAFAAIESLRGWIDDPAAATEPDAAMVARTRELVDDVLAGGVSLGELIEHVRRRPKLAALEQAHVEPVVVTQHSRPRVQRADGTYVMPARTWQVTDDQRSRPLAHLLTLPTRLHAMRLVEMDARQRAVTEAAIAGAIRALAAIGDATGNEQAEGVSRPADHPVTLNELERTIVAAIREHGPLQAKAFELLGYPVPNNSATRETLAGMVRHGVLKRDERGYDIGPLCPPE